MRQNQENVEFFTSWQLTEVANFFSLVDLLVTVVSRQV